MSFSRPPRIKHRDWILSAEPRIVSSLRLYRTGPMPKSIEGFMVVTPLKHALRGVYGSNLRAAWALLCEALWDPVSQWWGVLTYDADLEDAKMRNPKEEKP